MELSRRTIQRMILRKSGDTTVISQGSEGGGGGSQPSVALGPLLTSLNAEAMPTSEGYLHWTGSAWAFDTPTGGDPVDLTPYAQKTWVQTNYASKNDIAGFITLSEAQGLFAPINHTHNNYLPLTAGSSKPLTGSLYITGNAGITWVGGIGMMACQPESGWTGISSSQWGVGAVSAQGVIRSNASDLLHYRNNANYKIWDAYNFTPSDYLPLTGGTVESLTVTNGLDADSITVGSLVNSDTLAEYLDADAMQTWGDGRYLKLAGGTLTGRLVAGGGVYFGTNGYQGGVYYDNGLVVGANAVRILSDGVFTHNGSNVVTESSLPSRLPFKYLRNSNSDDDEQLGTIYRLILPLTVATDGAGMKYAQLNLSAYATQQWVEQQGYLTQTALSGYLPLTGGMLTGALMMGSANHKTNDDSAKIAFNTNVNYQNVSPYIQAIFENNYGRKRLSVFQKSVADWDTPQVEVFTILPNGNVGIGTIAPTEKLHVAGNIKATGNMLLPSSGSLSIEGVGAVHSNNGTLTVGGTAVAVESDGVFTFNGDQVATVSSLSGYLPLSGGTLSGHLNIANGSGLYVKDTGGTNRIAVLMNSQNQFFVGFGMRQAGYEGYFDSGVLHFRTTSGEMTMLANGNVGIGTTTPAYKLDVNGDTGITGSLDVSIELSVGDVTNGGVWLSDSALGIWTMSGTSRQDTELMGFASSGVIMTGKLAVGTTAFDGSNAKLQVGGNMFATGSITSKSNAGNVTLSNGNVSATNLYIATVIFGSSNNDAAIYVSNGHVWARNSSGTSTMIV